MHSKQLESQGGFCQPTPATQELFNWAANCLHTVPSAAKLSLSYLDTLSRASTPYLNPNSGIRRSRIDAIVRCGHAHCPVSAGEIALGSLCSPSRRVNDCEYAADRAPTRG